jgi:hypothetical protein
MWARAKAAEKIFKKAFQNASTLSNTVTQVQ